jgi:hypothetical protein
MFDPPPSFSASPSPRPASAPEEESLHTDRQKELKENPASHPPTSFPEPEDSESQSVKRPFLEGRVWWVGDHFSACWGWDATCAGSGACSTRVADVVLARL